MTGSHLDMPIQVLIADSQIQVRRALRLLLEQQPGLTLAEAAADAQTLLALLKQGCPDLTLLDWELPGADLADLILDLRKTCPDLYVIALGGQPDVEQADLAATGANVFVSKADPPERLLAAVQDFAHQKNARK
jgi:DNA-binding NarL/FixJ family response regulator